MTVEAVSVQSKTFSSTEAVSASASTAAEKAQVSFFTYTSKYVVSDRPVLVPVDSSPAELSRLLVHLLEAGGEILNEEEREKLSFNFLFEGKLLMGGAGALKESMLASSWTLERAVRLEYVEASPEPEELEAPEQPDWIRSLAAGAEWGVVSGGAGDGIVRVLDREGKAKASFAGHSGMPCTALAFIGNRLVTGSLDQQSFILSQSTDGSALEIQRRLQVPEEGQVVCVASIIKPLELIALGMQDGRIAVYGGGREEAEDREDTSSEAEAKETDGNKKSKRRRVVHTANAPLRRAKFVLNAAHSGAVTSVFFLQRSGNTTPLLLSSGLDGTVKAWDLSEQSPAFILHNGDGSAPITAMALNRSRRLLCAHPDGSVRLWDLAKPLETASALCSRTFFASEVDSEAFRGRFVGLHNGWISAVTWAPVDDTATVFATAGYDGRLCIWDTRSNSAKPRPIFEAADKGKLLTISWIEEAAGKGHAKRPVLRAAGQDAKVYTFQT